MEKSCQEELQKIDFKRQVSHDDWVWVKEKPFTISKDYTIPNYMVQWNEVDNLFDITCGNVSEEAKDEEDNSTRGAFTFAVLKSIYQTIHGINPQIKSLPSSLPKQPRGLTAIFVGLRIPRDMKKVCSDLENYFNHAAEMIGPKVLSEVMFEETSEATADYYEKMSDIYKQELLTIISFAEEELKTIAFERDNCTVMCDLEDVYQREDESVDRLIATWADYYNFLLQPYLDSISLANKQIQHFSQQKVDDNLEENARAECQEKHLYWACLLIETKAVVQNLYIDHQTAVVSIFDDLLKQIHIDKDRYGASAFDLIAANRELRICKELSSAEVQLLKSQRKLECQEKDKVDMQIPDDKDLKDNAHFEELKARKHKLQEKIFDCELKILSKRRQYLNYCIDLRKRELTDEEESSIKFHDAVEDVEGLSEEDEERLVDKDEELLKLKKERNKVSQHASRIRTKKERFLSDIKDTIQRREAETQRLEQFNMIKKKREMRQEKENERSSFVFEERKKTIDRLKEYKVKYPSPATIKPPRYQKPSEKKPRKGQNVEVKRKSSDTKQTAEKPWKTGKGKRASKTVDIPVTIHVSTPATIHVSTPASVPVPSAPPPPPPPPPPPLPPPLPPGLMTQSVRTKGAGGGLDLSEGLNKLKTVKCEAGGKSEGVDESGLPDLSSILASRSRLRPANDRVVKHLESKPDPFSDMFSLIRSGVALKKVDKSVDSSDPMTKSVSSTTSEWDARSLLHSTLLTKISKSVRGSSPVSDDEDGSENDEFDDSFLT